MGWPMLCYAIYVCHVTMFALPTGILDNTLDYYVTIACNVITTLRLMMEILHYLKDPKLWELWDIPHYG